MKYMTYFNSLSDIKEWFVFGKGHDSCFCLHFWRKILRCWVILGHIFIFLFHSLFVQSDSMKTHHCCISERGLKHVIYLISDYCSWFVCCSGNIILVERSPGRCNFLFFALLVIFDYLDRTKETVGE